ncbi:hypothetical protein MKK65_29290 [Methylobacterium sp. J-001]|uniref:hypothetical protein n=1 Tax=Methylobacterium sp. J-001 TaxID=2836609 RepID=UPI001FB89C43|nr:hypothetical protein [Methylobacterium sp. J-001]MCJ2120612.1 hypothetical protein [Methylobacterium sp. J-001]
MNQVELINVVMASVAQVTHRRIACVRPTDDFAAVVSVEGGTSAQKKANISVLLCPSA